MDIGEEDQINRRIDVGFGALRELEIAVRQNLDGLLEGLKIQTDAILVETLAQHQDHLRHHGVEQTDVDPYKLVSWFGCMLLGKATVQQGTLHVVTEGTPPLKCPFRVIGEALIDTLAGMLAVDSEEKIILPGKSRMLLLQMLVAQKLGNDDQGIWQNGLYAAFHSCVVCLRLLTEEDHLGNKEALSTVA